MPKLLYATACLLALPLFQCVMAQVVNTADSSDTAVAVALASQHYTRTVQAESSLYNGPEYVNYAQPSTLGHQFFRRAEAQIGSISYNGGHYQNVPLSYDLVRGLVVLQYPNQAATVALVTEKVTSFTLDTHQFVRLADDSTADAALPAGFYEVLLAGPVSLLARHTKQVQQTQVQQNLRLEFRQTDKLYAKTATAAAEVTSLKKLLALLPAHKPEVQRYARAQQLRFGPTDREAAALSLLRYYYTLL